jgi:PAS domain S-box-containing protein
VTGVFAPSPIKPVGVSRTDLTGRFTFANRCYCEIVGYAQEELLGMRMQDITHPEDMRSRVGTGDGTGTGAPR